MARRPGSNKASIELRQLKVRSLGYSGFSVSEMAAKLGVSVDTIKRDMRTIRLRELKEACTNLNVQNMQAYAYGQHQENLRRIDDVYANGTNREKAVAVRLRQHEIASFVRMLQSLGALPRTPARVHIVHRLGAAYQALPESVRARMREALDQGNGALWRQLTQEHLLGILPGTADIPDAEFEPIDDDV